MNIEELYYIEPVNYYICGSTGSGKTWLVKKWLEEINKKNKLKLDYSGKKGVIRADLGRFPPIMDNKIVIYENFNPRKKGICYYGIPDLNEFLISTVFISRDNVKNTTNRVRRMFKEFRFKIIDMDKERRENETVEQTVNRILGIMKYPYFEFLTKEEFNNLNEKKPKAPQIGDN